MKEGDKIIFPDVTDEQLVEIGIRHYDSQSKVLALCGKEVTIESIEGGVEWGDNSEFVGVFEIQESIFGFPLNWIILK